jgi:TP901 family phage tail tape measure protein
MQMDLGTLVAHLKLDNQSYLSGMASVNRSLDHLSNKMYSFGLKMGLYVTAPLVLLGRSSIKEFSAFDKAITRSIGFLKDANLSMKGELAETALNLSTKVATSATNLAKGYEEMGQAGMGYVKAMEVLPEVQKFAYVGMMEMTEAVKYLTKSQRALGMEMEDPIKNMEQMKRVSDNLTYAAIESTAKVLDFSEAMKNAGPMLRVLNKEIEEGVAALMTLANQGHVGSEAGTQLYMVYRDLQRAFITHKSTWKEFGLDVYHVTTRNMLPLHDIIAQLEVMFGNLTDEGMRTALMLLGFQDRSLRATQAMIGQSNTMRRFYHDLKDIAGITDRVAKINLTSFADQMEIIKNKFNVIKIAIAGIIADQLLKLGDVIDRLLMIWKGLTEEAQKWIVYMAEIMALIGPLSIAAAFLLKGFSGLLAVFAALVSPMGALLTLLGYLALSSTKVAEAFEGLKDTATSLYQTVTEKFRNWTEEDTVNMQKYVEMLGVELKGLQSKFGAFVDYLRNDFLGATKLVWQVFVEGVTFVGATIVEVLTRSAILAYEAIQDAFAGKFSTAARRAIGADYWANMQENMRKQTEDEYQKFIQLQQEMELRQNPGLRRTTIKPPYTRSWTTDALRVPSHPEIYAQIEKRVKGRMMEDIFREYPSARAGKSQEEIELLVNIAIQEEELGMQIKKVQDKIGEGLSGAVSGYFDNMLENIRILREQEGQITSPERFAYVNRLKEIEGEIQREKELVEEKYKGLVAEKERLRVFEEWQEEMEAAFGDAPTDFMPEWLKNLPKADTLSLEEINEFIAAREQHEQEIRKSLASSYEGLMDQEGAYEAQLRLIKDQRLHLKAMLGDHPIIAKWYQRQLDLLEAMNDEQYEQKAQMYETLRDANGQYEMRLKLLNSERAVMRSLVNDEDLRTKYYERQVELLEIQRDRKGDDLFEGAKAGASEMMMNMETLGELGYKLSETLRDGLSGAFTDALMKSRDLKESLRDMGMLLVRMLMYHSISRSITMMMGAAQDRNYAYPNMMTSNMGFLGNALGSALSSSAGHAEGGLVTQPHMALVGEAGPELIIPWDELSKPAKEPVFNVEVHNQTSTPIAASNIHFDPKNMVMSVLLKDERNRGPIYRQTRRR